MADDDTTRNLIDKLRFRAEQSSQIAMVVVLADAADALEDRLDNPRDSSHTMQELYHYRMLYNALAFNALAKTGTPVFKSWYHHDGELCFGGGWFIVVATLPTGQVSNHYPAKYWDKFHVPETDTPPAYDGHTPAIVVERIEAFLENND